MRGSFWYGFNVIGDVVEEVFRELVSWGACDDMLAEVMSIFVCSEELVISVLSDGLLRYEFGVDSEATECVEEFHPTDVV